MLFKINSLLTFLVQVSGILQICIFRCFQENGKVLPKDKNFLLFCLLQKWRFFWKKRKLGKNQKKQKNYLLLGTLLSIESKWIYPLTAAPCITVIHSVLCGLHLKYFFLIKKKKQVHKDNS